MILRYFYDDSLAQASYMVGCAATGEALIIDPARDVSQYLTAAAREGLRITYITETHIHADYVSGSRELAAASGGLICLSEAGGEAAKYGYRDVRRVLALNHGDMFMVGNIRVDVLHTPGHTPEHLAFMITDTAGADRPMGIFTGDALFVGDVGRPDLLEKAVGVVGSAESGARQQYASIQLFKTLPDYLQIWPGHGAGSACGKALGAVPSTTLGYEKLFNPAFQFGKETDFVTWLLDGQPEPPRYFAEMKHVNAVGPALLADIPAPQKLDRPAIDEAIASGAFVLDVRPGAAFIHAHIAGSVSGPSTSRKLSTFVGSIYDYHAPVILLMPDEREMESLLINLRAVGIDDIRGYATADVILPQDVALPVISAEDLRDALTQHPVMVIDVRGRSDYDACHIDGAVNIPLAEIHRRLPEIPQDKPVAIYCASGYRAQMTVSFLRARGWKHVTTMTDSEKLWMKTLRTSTASALSA